MKEKFKKIMNVSLPFIIVGIFVVVFILWYSYSFSPNEEIEKAHEYYASEDYYNAIDLFLNNEKYLSEEDKLLLASCYRKIGNTEKSLEIYNEMTKTMKDEISLAKIKINIGNTEVENGNIIDALKIFKEAIELSEDKDIEVNTHAKKVYSFIVSDFPITDDVVMEAVEYLMVIAQYDENTNEINYRIGKLIYYLEDYTYAEKFAQKVIDKDHTFSPAYRLKGEIYLKAGLHQKAIASFRKAIEYNLKDYESYRLLGKTYEDLGNETNALFNYRQALSINPNDVESRFFLAGLLLKQNDKYNASSELMTIIKIAPNSYYGKLAQEVLEKIAPKFINPVPQIKSEETNE